MHLGDLRTKSLSVTELRSSGSDEVLGCARAPNRDMAKVVMIWLWRPVYLRWSADAPSGRGIGNEGDLVSSAREWSPVSDGSEHSLSDSM